ncbi:hypothetical protein [Nonomuraea sp. NPDC049480]|uniref:hypothetical protein n=1 Tax=Nonomuraea sp. NPDC049480 TaxID=3364353 RepID=UPI00378EE00B
MAQTTATPPYGIEQPRPHAGSHPMLSAEAAHQLRAQLQSLDIPSDVHVGNGYDLALVSVWVGLVVWCDGDWFWWRAGWDDRRKRVVYARHRAIEPARAARRVAFRYVDLRKHHPLSEVVDDLPSSIRPSDESPE